ncbi:hypothetical protein KC318_g11335 [Hortaea werneckii]|uniref:Alanyl-transfer RNA synthetases family profile domain-containing protein n=1 Tax=Hortaea werneckii TaxID=91943 RepID=A0A3M7APH5_HORWE|nr:hypothetical protein KC334_g11351 [Hortaea werneckii]KAI6973972.1 hypothetical protein KC355_g11543 [Hortaea werneckii]KAI7658255.1 hypothetical protein KC318_g11335 [Hortaea werneckii]RMX99223.1 hypothetical protein D0867_12175 [Hortaea werneckii]RMY29337.1 hypothetical protein D0866_08767 [Hortaea werneckii]
MADTSFPSDRQTKAIYQYEEGLRNHIARVVAIQPFSGLSDAERGLFKTGSENTYALETNETIFYTQGGGQPFDTGYIEAANHGDKRPKFIVEAVRNAPEGRILHFGHFEDPLTASLEAGDIIEQHIDGARRDLNSRVHTAGHLIALSIRQLAQQEPDLNVTELKAQHYPETSFVEFQGSIDSKFKEVIQTQSTQYVKDALPVKLTWYFPDELHTHAVITAEGMPIVAGADGKVRVVDIVGAGAYPCGGTHVPDTSRVGGIVVKGIKRQKGNSKVSYAVLDAK